MESGQTACERVGEAIGRILDGERPDAVRLEGEHSEGAAEARTEILEALKRHLATCKACRRTYALDLALVAAISDAPEVPHTSVAQDAVRIARARLKRRSLVRWGAVVGAVCVVLAVTNSLGFRVFDLVLRLISGGTASPEIAAGGKVLSLVVGLAQGAKNLLLGGLGSMLGPGGAAYRLEILLAVSGIGLMVILMMYAMELWLRRPRGVGQWR